MNRDALRDAAADAAYGPPLTVDPAAAAAFRGLPAHGTYTRYASSGCRCGRCKTAKRDYDRQFRARRASEAVPC